MRKFVISTLTATALAAVPTLAFATEAGTAAGAAGGAIAGGAVGGPVGAAVGAGVGGVAGHTATGPNHRVIEHRRVETTGSVGCTTRAKHKTNEFGDSKTVRKTDC